MATALFVCLHNAGRSQMSAALFERAAGGRHHALSAGSEADPGGRVHPQVVEVMRELGIDLCQPPPATADPRARRAGGRRRDHGLRRRVPIHSGQALCRLGARRPQRPSHRGGAGDTRRHRTESQRTRRRTRQRARHVTLARAGGSAQRVARWRAAHARQANVTSTSAAANGNPPAGETAVHSTPATPLATRFPRL